MVAGRRLGEDRKLSVTPIKIPRVDQHSADAAAMATDPLGGGFNDDVHSVIEWSAQVSGGSEGVVDHQGNAVAMGHVGDGLEVGDVVVGVSHRLQIDGPGLFSDGRFEVARIVAFDKLDAEAHTGESHFELVVGASVQEAGRDDFIAGFQDGCEGQELSRLPRSGGHCCQAALQSGDPLLEDVGGGVHDPGVDVPELLQTEQPGGVVGVVEDIGGGLIDGHRPGVGPGRRLLAGMDL